MEFIDYYKVLGVDKNASEEDIKKLTANWQENCTPILIPTIKKPIKNFSRSMKPMKY